MPKDTIELDLWIDESGQFVNGDRGAQIAGILAQRHILTEPLAKRCLAHCHREAGLQLNDDSFHSTLLTKGKQLDALVISLAGLLAQENLQAVRIVNCERVIFGDQKVNYVNMVAELAIRIIKIYHQKYPNKRIDLAITGARYMTQNGSVQVFRDEYNARLQEYVAFLTVRHGWAAELCNWNAHLDSLKSGKYQPELQLCDLISNTSFNNFHRLGSEAKVSLKAAMNVFDFTMTMFNEIDLAMEFLGVGSIGLAIEILASCATRSDIRSKAKKAVNEQLVVAIEKLALMGARNRDAQLRVIISWLEQLTDDLRDIRRTIRIYEFIRDNFIEPIYDKVGIENANTLHWFDLEISRWILTAYNHAGDPIAARPISKTMENKIKYLVGRWEHTPLLMECLVVQAVHFTDCFEYQKACNSMEAVSNFYRDLASLFRDAMPSMFPQKVYSTVRGKALGTWLQSETLLGLSDSAHLVRARKLSDEAIEEFEAPDDKKRQFQYRSQIETYAGQFVEARRYLAKSLPSECDITHDAIIKTIRTLPDCMQGFPLLHWLRIGKHAIASGDKEEATAFNKALHTNRVMKSHWVLNKQRDYPAHGIRRHLTSFMAANGQFTEAKSVLASLTALGNFTESSIVLRLIQIAAQSEFIAYAAILGERVDTFQITDDLKCNLQDLINRNKKLKKLDETEGFASVDALLGHWLEIINVCTASKKERLKDNWNKLLKVASTVGY